MPLPRTYLSNHWSGDEQAWDQDKKIESLEPGFRAKVQRIMYRLRRRGWRPHVYFAWRSPLTQERLVAEGVSKTDFSFHNALDHEGRPAGLAGDIVDARYMWGIRRIQDPSRPGRTKDVKNPDTFEGALGFFKALGEEAAKEGLIWGGKFRVDPQSLWAPHGIGWDLAHLQALPQSRLPAVHEHSQGGKRMALRKLEFEHERMVRLTTEGTAPLPGEPTVVFGREPGDARMPTGLVVGLSAALGAALWISTR